MNKMLSFLVAVILGSAYLVAAPGLKDKDKDKAFPMSKEDFESLAENYKQLGLGMHSYHDAYGHLPVHDLNKDKKSYLSWRVHLLPFFEEDTLYREFKLDEPWDSEHNKKLIEKMPKIYQPRAQKIEKGLTFVQRYSGKTTMFDGRTRFADIVDGLSNTFMVIDGDKPVIWTKPDDMEFNPKKLVLPGGQFSDYFIVCLGDGSVRKVKKDIKSDVLKAYITSNGGEVVNGKELDD